MDKTIILCTMDELVELEQEKAYQDDNYVLTLDQLFDFLLEYYGYEPGFQPNDVY